MTLGGLIVPTRSVATLLMAYRSKALNTSRGFYRTWLLAFTKSFASHVSRVVALFTPREKYISVENTCEMITRPISGQVFPDSETWIF